MAASTIGHARVWQLQKRMHQLQLIARAAHADGSLPRGAWISILHQAIRDVIVQGQWGHALHAFVQGRVVNTHIDC